MKGTIIMARYKNVSSTNLHLGENRFVGPNLEVEITEQDLQNHLISKAVKGGWLIPFVENAANQIINQEFNNEINHITHHPVQPFHVDFNIPIGKTAKKKDTTQEPEYIQKAIERAKLERQERDRAKLLKQIGYNEDEVTYQPPTVHAGDYGNIEHNIETSVVVAYDGGGFGPTSSPSKDLDAAVDRMLEPPTKSEPIVKPKRKRKV